LRLERACGGDFRCGIAAALHRAGVHRLRGEFRGDAAGDGFGLLPPPRGELQFHAAAETLGMDAFDFSVSGEDDLHRRAFHDGSHITIRYRQT